MNQALENEDDGDDKFSQIKKVNDQLDAKSVDFVTQKRRMKSIDDGYFSIFSYDYAKDYKDPTDEMNLLNQDFEQISNNQRIN